MTLAPRALAIACFTTGMALAAPIAQAAEAVYRWVDANGVVHFTQNAPRGVPYEQVSTGGPGSRNPPSFYNPRRTTPTAPARTEATPAPDDGAGAVDTELQQRQAELQAEAQARLSELAAARRRNCEMAREQFEEFTTFARIRVSDGQGGMRILSEEERAERVAEAEQAILVNCDDAG
ncbi:MAG: DUF4124 domain-containing protein [Pseudomonadales bacterium]|jgi:hypothetical protein|nr:DUF4124 domain-containing protein [Pseudomonadales bacterium]